MSNQLPRYQLDVVIYGAKTDWRPTDIFFSELTDAISEANKRNESACDTLASTVVYDRWRRSYVDLSETGHDKNKSRRDTA